jgi:hypothetical protein
MIFMYNQPKIYVDFAENLVKALKNNRFYV